jgi:hypothetical protein
MSLARLFAEMLARLPASRLQVVDKSQIVVSDSKTYGVIVVDNEKGPIRSDDITPP